MGQGHAQYTVYTQRQNFLTRSWPVRYTVTHSHALRLASSENSSISYEMSVILSAIVTIVSVVSRYITDGKVYYKFEYFCARSIDYSQFLQRIAIIRISAANVQTNRETNFLWLLKTLFYLQNLLFMYLSKRIYLINFWTFSLFLSFFLFLSTTSCLI